MVNPKYEPLRSDVLIHNESILLDIINNSAYFLKKSDYELYRKPIQECNGEPDAITNNYAIDFKLLWGQEGVKTEKFHQDHVYLLGKGAIAVGGYPIDSKQVLNTPKQFDTIHKLLENHDFTDNESLTGKRKSIKNIKTALEKKYLGEYKNLLWFYPMAFYDRETYQYEEFISLIGELLFKYFKSLQIYRNTLQSDSDMFLLCVVKEYFVIYEFTDNALVPIDKISCELSKEYMTYQYQRLF